MPKKKKKPAAKKARRVTQTPAAKPSAAVCDAPEGAVFDHAAKLHGEWVSTRRPGGPKGPAPVWCVWRGDFELMDDDDTPLKGAWEVKWSDRNASFLARDDVRVCVPTRERLKAEAQAPTPPKRGRRVTESPAPALHTLPDRQLNKQRSLATGAERARVRGKFKVTGELCAHLVSIWRVMRIPCEQLASYAHTWRVTGELCE